MPGCATKCTTYSRDSIQAAWEDIRYHFGPRIPWSTSADSLAAKDVSAWNVWATANGVDPVTDVDKFGKWLIWKCSYGTTEYGNLPTRKRNHVGISAGPCPYDILIRSSEERSLMWTGLTSLVRADHTVDGKVHYMKVTSKGNLWGFECTYSGCPYQNVTGYPYFHA
jgi:hypothetical protein